MLLLKDNGGNGDGVEAYMLSSVCHDVQEERIFHQQVKCVITEEKTCRVCKKKIGTRLKHFLFPRVKTSGLHSSVGGQSAFHVSPVALGAAAPGEHEPEDPEPAEESLLIDAGASGASRRPQRLWKSRETLNNSSRSNVIRFRGDNVSDVRGSKQDTAHTGVEKRISLSSPVRAAPVRLCACGGERNNPALGPRRSPRRRRSSSSGGGGAEAERSGRGGCSRRREKLLRLRLPATHRIHRSAQAAAPRAARAPPPPRARLRSPPYGLTMRRIRANAIAILTVAWILGTFYYLWQDNKPQSSSSPSLSAAQTRGRGGGHGQKGVSGRLEIHRDDRTIPLIPPLFGRPSSRCLLAARENLKLT
ncbi:Polypeptide N-acetylgalactosaminyltransferase 16 [Liparis tanakae]|uniref:Polypeptide N-acetylgalactosaminyltransferase 16 n=1 Tax=Liparis tanakae TaxID=230148 RepID=A0A4Z2FKI1_9TELE|nr:Polypeptide N-acetylgalactosaminyltransferase 16 [Liparis tanakae]